jgi:hypothetical protein
VVASYLRQQKTVAPVRLNTPKIIGVGKNAGLA